MINRTKYAACLIVAIVLGLASREEIATQLPAFVHLYAGDTLWATAGYMILALLMPDRHPVQLATLALAVGIAVELSQFYDADWINSIRSTRLGALSLGFGFLWSDLVCYSVGVSIGVMVDVTIMKKTVLVVTESSPDRQ